MILKKKYVFASLIYCNKIKQINNRSSRWWITRWESNEIFEKKILLGTQPRMPTILDSRIKKTCQSF